MGIPVTLSSELVPEFREYERLCTTLINAYIAPLLSFYIDHLASQTPGVPLFIQQSSGGILPADGISDHAVQTILSGPAGGVFGAFHLAQQVGITKIITFDMGGTSTDVSLCDNKLSMTREYSIEGFPVRTPVIDIHTVGAGGGSLAWIDAGGLLQVGPESAGADPGPVCYGKGEVLTVTDANLYLGRLLPDRFLDGLMPLDRMLVEHRMQKLAERLGMAPDEAALGIIRIVNANMVKAIRAVSVERGHDPGEFALFSFGGAAGLHCCELARELGVNKIFVPNRAGILSAQGMILSDPTLDRVQALFLVGAEISKKTLENAFARLEQEILNEALRLSPKHSRFTVQRYLDLRYKGQSHELTVQFTDDFRKKFHDVHKYAYGYDMKSVPLELVAIRISLTMPRPKIRLPRSNKSLSQKPCPAGETNVVFERGLRKLPLYQRKDLLPGHTVGHPALIVDSYTTILLDKDFDLAVDPLLNLIIDRRQENDKNY